MHKTGTKADAVVVVPNSPNKSHEKLPASLMPDICPNVLAYQLKLLAGLVQYHQDKFYIQHHFLFHPLLLPLPLLFLLRLLLLLLLFLLRLLLLLLLLFCCCCFCFFPCHHSFRSRCFLSCHHSFRCCCFLPRHHRLRCCRFLLCH